MQRQRANRDKKGRDFRLRGDFSSAIFFARLNRARGGWLLALALALMGPALSAAAQTNATANTGQTNQTDLTELPIEKLMDVEVTTVSKKSEKLSESAAAVSVLTQDDIQRSGATSIPEALRLVPGLDVAQVDSQQWAISARGFNDIFANKLLVMQDGRSLYTPLFSGVFWDVQNTPLEDIDRIEVVRGPGASLWGDNAVNGVINIITKDAKDTQGMLVSAGGGNYEQGFGMVRYGGQLDDNVYYRIYGQYFNRGDSADRSADADDSWQMGQGGFRVDWDASEQNKMTLQGDIYGGALNQAFGTFDLASPTLMQEVTDVVHVGGGNVLGRWTYSFSDDSELKLQMYFDRTDRETTVFSEQLDTYDVDLQHTFSVGERNDFVWGLGYRFYADTIGNTPTVALNPNEINSELFSAFAQDEITLIEKRLRLTLGARLEHNDYTGIDFQPNARLLWTPDDRQTVWSAVSRAVRTPSEAEEYIALTQVIPPNALGTGNPPLPYPATILGNQSFESETLIAYELGYRVRPCSGLSLDVTGYFNSYDHLRSEEFGAVTPPAPVPITLENLLDGYTYGVEAAPTWQVCDWWRLQPAYTLLKMHLNTDPGSTDPVSVNTIEGESPQQQVSLRSSMDLPQNISFDWTVRYVDRLPAFNINSYVALDVRVAWRPTKKLELAIVGQNLGSSHHAEFSPTFISTQQTEVRASGYGKVTWHF